MEGSACAVMVDNTRCPVADKMCAVLEGRRNGVLADAKCGVSADTACVALGYKVCSLCPEDEYLLLRGLFDSDVNFAKHNCPGCAFP